MNSLTSILLLWIALIVAEIVRNWYIIDEKNSRPVYSASTMLRIVVGFIFWLTTPVVFEISYYQWWGMVFMMLFTFWFIFDYGLNQFRNIVTFKFYYLPFFYLNRKGSWLDQMQCNYPHPFPWFCFKVILMVGGIALFYYGIDFIWTVKY